MSHRIGSSFQISLNGNISTCPLEYSRRQVSWSSMYSVTVSSAASKPENYFLSFLEKVRLVYPRSPINGNVTEASALFFLGQLQVSMETRRQRTNTGRTSPSSSLVQTLRAGGEKAFLQFVEKARGLRDDGTLGANELSTLVESTTGKPMDTQQVSNLMRECGIVSTHRHGREVCGIIDVVRHVWPQAERSKLSKAL